jgi:hypothetical protein
VGEWVGGCVHVRASAGTSDDGGDGNGDITVMEQSD